MQKRRYGRCSVEISALGFGMMRLPVIDNDPAKIDEEATSKMIHYAVDHGVNYIDTAYNYHRGESENVVGRILKGDLRKKVFLATKCPTWLVKSRQDFDVFLEEQRKKLQTDHIDMYLMHSLTKGRWSTIRDVDVGDFLDKAKADGRIRFAGFSFHDDVATFKSIVDSYDWDFCQIQFNYMDEHNQAGVEGLEYASKKGLAVNIMEPLRGGSLVNNVPPEVRAVWDKASVKRSPAEWGLRWVWNHPEVSVVLSGMGTMEQVQENVRTAETAYPGSLTAEELSIIDEVKKAYRLRTKVSCTGCQYCQPCPQGIVIPEWFSSYNTANMFNTLDSLGKRYDALKGEMGDLMKCVECGKCEIACPQHLPIRSLLKELRETLGVNR